MKNQRRDPWKIKKFSKSKNFFVKNISFNPKNAFPHPIVGLFAENSLRKSIWVSLGKSIHGPQTDFLNEILFYPILSKTFNIALIVIEFAPALYLVMLLVVTSDISFSLCHSLIMITHFFCCVIIIIKN